MKLPTEKTPPKRNVSDITMLAYGKSKLGKSSFAAQAPKALFLATEPGLNALDTYEIPITTWEDFLAACAEISKGGHDFKTIVIDTIDILYRLCAKFVCDKRGLEHESDGAHGKAYGLIKNEIYRALTKLAHLPYGLILISHSQDKELETRTGKVTRTVPTLSDSFRQVVVGLVDLILYFDIEEEKKEDGTIAEHRVIRTKPNKFFDAGDRFGVLPTVMPLDYATFEKAFTGAGVRGLPAAEDKPPAKAAKGGTAADKGK